MWDSQKIRASSLHAVPRLLLVHVQQINQDRFTHQLHAVFLPVGREAPLPLCSPATSSRQRRSNHPKQEMIREGCSGIIHATCCWYTTEAPTNPLSLCRAFHPPGGVAGARGCFVSGSPLCVAASGW